ncbi:MAG: hypothetical protein JEY96_16825 [Bacteroidales bacterium]|nr:hypothetical protein [Bacteroidales bacterium]
MKLALIIFFWVMLFVHVVYVYRKGKPTNEELENFKTGLKQAREKGLI